MKLFRKYQVLIGFILILLWQFLLIFQGVDLADTGFHLTAFRFIFEDPYSVQYSMSFWLSDVCGYIWMNLWPIGGLYWARIGWIVIITISLIIYYSLLRPELSIGKTLIGLGITTIFILQGGPECLNYDMFSILGYAISVTLLYRALTNHKISLLLASGFLLGVSVFFKLTNLSGLLLFLMIPFSMYLQKKTFSYFIKLSFIYIISFITGIGSVLLLIKLTGHLNLFLENLSFISSMTKDSEASHGFIPLITSYLSGYLNAFVILPAFLLVVWVYIRISDKYSQIRKEKLLVLYYIGLIAIIVLLMFTFERVFWSKVRYLFIGLMLLEGGFSAFNKTKANKIRLLYFAGLILLVIAPLGSDSGLEKSVFGMWILGPLVLKDLNLNQYFTKLKIKLSELQTTNIQKTLTLIILVTSILFAWQNTYFDTGSRFKKASAINHPQMTHIYTSIERAEAINELIKEAFPNIKKEEYLLSFIEIPMINYLANKKPFISTSWPKLYYHPLAFEKKLYEAVEKRKKLPAIIRQKQNTMLCEWPQKNASPNYINYPAELSKWPEHGTILNSFIEKYSYHVKWENEMFQLLLVNK